MTIFEQILAIVVASEAGFTDDPADPGNWTGGSVGSGECRGTNFGISAAAYPTLDIARLSPADAHAIYRNDYWNRISGDQLPPSLALLTFDAAVVCGVGQAARWLQEALYVTADGLIGPVTIAAVQRVARSGLASLCAEVLARRMVFMTSLPTWQTFGLGWSRRIARLPYQSLNATA